MAQIESKMDAPVHADRESDSDNEKNFVNEALRGVDINNNDGARSVCLKAWQPDHY